MKVLYTYTTSSMSSRLLQDVLQATGGDIKSCFVKKLAKEVDERMAESLSIHLIVGEGVDGCWIDPLQLLNAVLPSYDWKGRENVKVVLSGDGRKSGKNQGVIVTLKVLNVRHHNPTDKNKNENEDVDDDVSDKNPADTNENKKATNNNKQQQQQQTNNKQQQQQTTKTNNKQQTTNNKNENENEYVDDDVISKTFQSFQTNLSFSFSVFFWGWCDGSSTWEIYNM